MKDIIKCFLGLVGIALFPTLLLFTVFGLIGGFLWPYVLNTWFIFFGKATMITFWHGFIIGMLPYLGQLCIPMSIITFVIMLFI